MLGCSFSSEESLQRAGIPLRHIAAGCNVPMYVSSIATQPAGPFAGPMVVSMRAFSPADAIRAIVLSERHPLAHGAPVHIGDPAQIGIQNLAAPDFGDPPVLEPGDIPAFWACGMTPQVALRAANPEIAITHEPGCMLVTDLPAEGAPSASTRRNAPHRQERECTMNRIVKPELLAGISAVAFAATTTLATADDMDEVTLWVVGS